MKELVVIANNINEAINVAFQLGISSQAITFIDEDNFKNIKDYLKDSLVIMSDASYPAKTGLYKECLAAGSVGLHQTGKFIEFEDKVLDAIKVVDELYYNLTSDQDTKNGADAILEKFKPTILDKSNGFDFKVARLPNRNYCLIGNNDKSQLIVKLLEARINNRNN